MGAISPRPNRGFRTERENPPACCWHRSFLVVLREIAVRTGDLTVLNRGLSARGPRDNVIAVPIVPRQFQPVTLEFQLTQSLVSPKNREFLNVGEVPLVVLE